MAGMSRISDKGERIEKEKTAVYNGRKQVSDKKGRGDAMIQVCGTMESGHKRKMFAEQVRAELPVFRKIALPLQYRNRRFGNDGFGTFQSERI